MKKSGREIIGGGDLKLFISMCLFVGGVGTIFSLTISSFLGIVYYLFNKNRLIPFGPFLSIGYFVVFLLLGVHII
jgi:prepilin signal peptidase PulO-like enzyme (type II secretory pathway)